MSVDFVSFTIPGIPQQQGSKRYVGKGVSIDDNKNLRPWREVALVTARDARPRDLNGPVFAEPVRVTAGFFFPRPKAHYRTGKNFAALKDSAPVWHSSAPDLDKLLRAVGDILTQSQIVVDDRLIVHWSAGKFYGGDPRVDITVETMT